MNDPIYDLLLLLPLFVFLYTPWLSRHCRENPPPFSNLQRTPQRLYSCPKPTVSSTAIVSF
jgi:hypothetical protein